MTYQEALDWIHSRLTFGSRPELLRVEALLERLDNPHQNLRCVHIGGTNGKGSTVTDLRCLLEAENLKVGSFTSPFITSFNERVTINDQPISDEDLVRWVGIIQPLVAEMDTDEELWGITQFEIITVLMFAYFAEQKVDVALVEVGLGGRLDSTNVIVPLLSAITTIGLDHMDILGNTLAAIADQKAGIIKKERPVITGRIPEEALQVIARQAEELSATHILFDQDYVVTSLGSTDLVGEVFDFRNQWLDLKEVSVSLVGSHQVDNAALAIEIYCQLAEELGYTISESHIRSALAKAHWSGRFEVLKETPLVIIDGAHNEPAIDVLVKNCQERFPDKAVTVLFGALKTKDVSRMLGRLAEIKNSQLYVTGFDFPKALTVADYKALNVSVPIHPVESWQETMPQLIAGTSDQGVLLITGSLYFISQVRDYLLKGESL